MYGCEVDHSAMSEADNLTVLFDGVVLVTDRPDHSRRLKRDLNFIRPCRVASPHQPPEFGMTAAAIVSDVALDSAVSIELLRAALARTDRKRTPLICVLRDDCRQAIIQAHALGAYDLVRPNASRADFVDAVFRAITTTDDASSDGPAGVARRCAREAGFVLAEIMDAAEDGGVISTERLAEGAQLVLRAISEVGIRQWLDVVWSYDDVTYQHVLLVGGLTAAFSSSLGFSRKDCRRVTEAALLHDIGKAGIPAAILKKPSSLTDAEMAVMRTHPTIGYDILAAQGGFLPQVMAVVRSHHEYLDGSGYPDGLEGAAIPDMVRLVTICDICAALIERRPYREPLAPAAAVQVMRDMGGKLDADILEAFVKVAETMT